MASFLVLSSDPLCGSSGATFLLLVILCTAVWLLLWRFNSDVAL